MRARKEVFLELVDIPVLTTIQQANGAIQWGQCGAARVDQLYRGLTWQASVSISPYGLLRASNPTGWCFAENEPFPIIFIEKFQSC